MTKTKKSKFSIPSAIYAVNRKQIPRPPEEGPVAEAVSFAAALLVFFCFATAVFMLMCEQFWLAAGFAVPILATLAGCSIHQRKRYFEHHLQL